MNFVVLPSSTEPIYRQIVEQVRRLIASGRARAGDELPSVRALAELHSINPMTVSKAYSLLEAEGLLERRRGMGMVIATARGGKAPRAQRLALLEPVLTEAARQASQLEIDADDALRIFERCLKAQSRDKST